jgi:hypothetical protein
LNSLLPFNFTIYQRFSKVSSCPTRSIVKHLRREYEIAAIDPGIITLRLLIEVSDPVPLHTQCTETARGLHGRDRGQGSLLFVKGNELFDIYVAQPITVGETEILIPDVISDPLEAPPVIVLSPVSTTVTRHGSALFW